MVRRIAVWDIAHTETAENGCVSGGNTKVTRTILSLPFAELKIVFLDSSVVEFPALVKSHVKVDCLKKGELSVREQQKNGRKFRIVHQNQSDDERERAAQKRSLRGERERFIRRSHEIWLRTRL